MAGRQSAVLQHGPLTLRLLRRRDRRALDRELLLNRAWLRPWEATDPSGWFRPAAGPLIRALLDGYRAGTILPLVLEVDGRLVGQLNLSGISHGSLSSASIGYWIAEEFAGQGHTPVAVSLAADYGFGRLGLHRIEICIRPENAASLRVVEKLGFRYEGLRRRYIHIDGDWRDHVCFALVREEVPGGVLARRLAGAVPPEAARIPSGAEHAPPAAGPEGLPLVP